MPINSWHTLLAIKKPLAHSAYFLDSSPIEWYTFPHEAQDAQLFYSIPDNRNKETEKGLHPSGGKEGVFRRGDPGGHPRDSRQLDTRAQSLGDSARPYGNAVNPECV